MPRLPDATRRFPLVNPDGSDHREMIHLSAVIDHPNWSVGRHAYAYDFDAPADWARRLAPYLYPGAPERLVIGPFCQIAHGARFITASANHPMDGISTYPFAVFDPEAVMAYKESISGLPDTVIGPDCWIGHGALVLPGARLGAGVIVGAGAVVRGDIPPYSVVAGNPARILRRRFPDAEVNRLLSLEWWKWDTHHIERHIDLIASGDVAALVGAAPARRPG
jgi:virginiamycin A acetyltransferase